MTYVHIFWVHELCQVKIFFIIHIVLPRGHHFWWILRSFVAKSAFCNFCCIFANMFCRKTCFVLIYALFKWRKKIVCGGKTNIMYDHIENINYTLSSLHPLCFFCAPYPYLGWNVCFQKYTTRHIAEVSNITFRFTCCTIWQKIFCYLYDMTKDILPYCTPSFCRITNFHISSFVCIWYGFLPQQISCTSLLLCLVCNNW